MDMGPTYFLFSGRLFHAVALAFLPRTPQTEPAWGNDNDNDEEVGRPSQRAAASHAAPVSDTAASESKPKSESPPDDRCEGDAIESR
jgi:hypothetical protein